MAEAANEQGLCRYGVLDSPHEPEGSAASRRARRDLGAVRLVTTEEALSEFLTAFSKHGAHLRDAAARIVDEIVANPDIDTIPQSHDSFAKALDLFRKRSDKGYSMQDCASMNAMKAKGISKVLSSDRHFGQEGFIILMTAAA